VRVRRRRSVRDTPADPRPAAAAHHFVPLGFVDGAPYQQIDLPGAQVAWLSSHVLGGDSHALEFSGLLLGLDGLLVLFSERLFLVGGGDVGIVIVIAAVVIVAAIVTASVVWRFFCYRRRGRERGQRCYGITAVKIFYSIVSLLLLLFGHLSSLRIATLATGRNFVPNVFPFFSPGKGSIADHTNLGGQILFGNCLSLFVLHGKQACGCCGVEVAVVVPVVVITRRREGSQSPSFFFFLSYRSSATNKKACCCWYR